MKSRRLHRIRFRGSDWHSHSFLGSNLSMINNSHLELGLNRMLTICVNCGTNSMDIRYQNKIHVPNLHKKCPKTSSMTLECPHFEM